MADNIIQIGDFRIARTDRKWASRTDKTICAHRSIELDDHGEIVRCMDCGIQVSAYWGLKMLAEHWEDASRKHQSAANQLAADKAASLHLLAAKKAEQAWRLRDMVPTCPHCGEGITAKDGFGDCLINKQMDNARREARGRKPQTD